MTAAEARRLTNEAHQKKLLEAQAELEKYKAAKEAEARERLSSVVVQFDERIHSACLETKYTVKVDKLDEPLNKMVTEYYASLGYNITFDDEMDDYGDYHEVIYISWGA